MPKILTPDAILAAVKPVPGVHSTATVKDLFYDAAGTRVAKAVGVTAGIEVRDMMASDDRSVEFVVSTGALDRYNSTIAVDGWQLAEFNKNPVVLWAHDDSIPAIARAEATAPSSGKLRSRAVFADADTHPLADTVFRLIKGKFINAASVGWIPLEWKFVEDDGRGFGIDYLKQELLEWSVVNIPANPECLVGARSMGIDTRPLLHWAERALDQGGLVAVPRAELEALRKASDSRQRTVVAPGKRGPSMTSQVAALIEPLFRAGKVLSQENADCLRDASDHMQAAHDAHEVCRDHCAQASELVRSVLDKCDPDKEPDDPDADNGDTEDPRSVEDLEQRRRRIRLLKLRA